MLIYLIGYMGSGKTTSGKKLAKMLKYDFLDMDKSIEKRKGMTIDEIFEKEGELKFREYESEYLKECSQLKDTVISTGGGTPCFNDNMELIKYSGISIYLRLPVKTLHLRLLNSKKNRPLINDLSEKELFNYIQKQIREREPYYLQANEVVTRIENLDWQID